MSLAAFSRLHGNYGANYVAGVDVSGHQDAAELEQALAWARFAWIKTTEHLSFYAHEESAAHVEVCRRLKVPYGFYHFARPIFARPLEEAAHFARSIQALGGPGQLPPVLDLETPGTEGYDHNVYALTFLREIHRLAGVRPMIYSQSGFIDTYLSDPQLAEYGLWLAHFADPGVDAWCPVGPWQNWQAWQYAEESPEHGSLDLNIAKPSFIEALGLAVTEEVDVTPEQADQLNRIEKGLQRPRLRMLHSVDTGAIWLVWGLWRMHIKSGDVLQVMIKHGLVDPELIQVSSADLVGLAEVSAEHPPAAVVGIEALLSDLEAKLSSPPPVNLAGNFEAIADRMSNRLIEALKEGQI